MARLEEFAEFVAALQDFEVAIEQARDDDGEFSPTLPPALVRRLFESGVAPHRAAALLCAWRQPGRRREPEDWEVAMVSAIVHGRPIPSRPFRDIRAGA